MNKKLNLLKLTALSSLILLSSSIFDRRQVTAEEKNLTSIKNIENKQTNSNQVIEDSDLNLQFELQSCQRSSDIVNCSFLLTKTADMEPGREYQIRGDASSPSRAITPDGEQYITQTVQIGDNKEKGRLWVKPIVGVPIKIQMSFDIPTQFENLSALGISYCEQYSSDDREIVFKNVNISTGASNLGK